MNDKLLYQESLSSTRTTLIFLTLMLLCLLFFLDRVVTGYWDVWAIIFLGFFSFFLFYTLNFRTLLIRLTAKSLYLTFGIFTRRIPLENIAACYLDHLPYLLKYGGAGIHFMFVRNRYRASFNFLEYPRIAIEFKHRAGLVQDISFSTRHPDEVLRLLQEATSARLRPSHSYR